VPLAGRPAKKNKRGVPRDDAAGGQRANGTPDDDPLEDTPCSRVRIESSLAGFSKEVRIHIARCLFLAMSHLTPRAHNSRCVSAGYLRSLHITPQDIDAATPALLLKKDEKLLLFDLDRSTQGTTRQLKLADMHLNVGKYKGGRPKVGNEHYNQQWDAWVQPLIDALERQHGGSLPALMRRRHLAKSLAAEASARASAERDVIAALENAEVEKAALYIQGNRQSFARYNRARTIRCKEVRSGVRAGGCGDGAVTSRG